ncbi:MAG: hypothetical protein QGF59_05485, partial [Pirellulaceae bacterium]|nr:hypothetical protein [Pirellulaceae bacterium]
RAAVRAGDLEAAAQAKFNQITAFYMTKQAYAVRTEVANGNRYMRKFASSRKKFPSLPVDYLETIRDVLNGFQFGPRLSAKKRASLMEWAEAQAREEGVVVQIPQEISDADGSTNYQDMTLDEWRQLHRTVKDLHKEGRDLNKMRLEGEARTRQEIVDGVVVNVHDNLRHRTRTETDPSAAAGTEAVRVGHIETMVAKMKDAREKYGIDPSIILLNTDSILRWIDGWQDLGPAYMSIKGGIDRAMTEGYHDHQIGLSARQKTESAELVGLFDMFTKQERLALRGYYDVPGVRTRLTGNERLSVLLNMGNADNIQAMIDSDQFTMEELQAIVDAASEKEMQFAQAVWDYFQTFMPEIKETVKRRHNRIVQEVEAQTLTHSQFGDFRGGYFPLRYDSSQGILEGQTSVEEVRQRMMFGNFMASHTRDGHTQNRKGSGGRPVKLDPFVINNHVQEVIYDLEMGDAVIDSYKVLHHKDMKKAFADVGQIELWNALDIWLGDVTTGELHRGSMHEKFLRHVRTGTSIASLGVNLTVSLLQPLGVLQSSVQIGHTHMLAALYQMVKPGHATIKGGDPRNIFSWVSDQSGFMRERERSYNKEIIEADKALRSGFLAQITPGRTADHIADVYFYTIAKMQRIADTLTWMAAKRRGMMDFDGDDAKSTLYADRMVARSQGSGNFQERTAIERGTLSHSVRQTEVVRNFSLFLNYFAAKLNIAFERTQNTNFKNPIQVARYTADMAILFFVEGLAAALIREGWPEGEDEDERGLWDMMLQEGGKTFAAGVPGLREVVSAAEGFPTGGSFGSFVNKVWRAGDVVINKSFDPDEELTASDYKAINSVLGVFFRYPSGQMNKTGGAIYQEAEEEDTEVLDFLFGPKYKDD